MLSSVAKRAKAKFLNRNPHLYQNHPPVHLDEALELIEIYVKFFLEEKRKEFEKFLKNNNKKLKNLGVKL